MHDEFALVNLHQTSEERCLKYQIARMLGVKSNMAARLRDWHWSKLYGSISIDVSQRGGDQEAIKELCENGSAMFKGITKSDYPGY